MAHSDYLPRGARQQNLGPPVIGCCKRLLSTDGFLRPSAITSRWTTFSKGCSIPAIQDCIQDGRHSRFYLYFHYFWSHLICSTSTWGFLVSENLNLTFGVLYHGYFARKLLKIYFDNSICVHLTGVWRDCNTSWIDDARQSKSDLEQTKSWSKSTKKLPIPYRCHQYWDCKHQFWI